MAKAVKTLSFTCMWTQKSRDEDDAFWRAHKQFFEKHRGQSTLSINDPYRRTARYGCEDPIWSAWFRLNLYSPLPANQVESLSADIARHWCTSGATQHGVPSHLQWLQPERRHGFWQGFYAVDEKIKMQSIAFGTFVSLNVFAERHSIVCGSTDRICNIDCTFRHDERNLQIFLDPACCVHTTDRLYRLSMPYSNIFRVVVHDPIGRPTDVFLLVHTLPLFHKAENILDLREQMNFRRTLEVGCKECGLLLESRDVGGCFVVRLTFSRSHEARRIVGRLRRRCRRAGFVFAPVKTHRLGSQAEKLRQQLFSGLMPKLKFACCYALNALIQMSDDIVVQLLLLEKQELDAILMKLELYAAHNEGALEEALFNIVTALERHSFVTFSAALPALFERLCKTYVPTRVPQGTCMVRRLFVTPSRVFFLRPAVHTENRVLRKFDPSYALRVSFRDDHFEFLSHTLAFQDNKREMMDKVVGCFLRDGIKIGDRHFRLLASSVSQLRDHGVWLYAKDNLGNSVESIRAWMGDFSQIPNVAKKIARMGQCFSTTEESVVVPLHGETMEDVADIEGGIHPVSGKPFVFSDGIGMISESLMKKVCEKLDMAQIPSAIQIRYAGYKGMLCTNNALRGDKLILRKSMNKFVCSTSNSLEVIKVSAPSVVYLNRPLITILEQLGVPERVFLHLQQNMVLQLCDALVSDAAALPVLSTYTHTSLPFSKLRMGGLSLCREPFTRSLMLAVYKSMFDGLKEKSRIAISPDKGRNMLGVLDETGTLEYGQVFVQFTHLGVDLSCIASNGSNSCTPKTQVLTGTVLVTKCPCLHPGDVRKFEAVDVPALRHIRDCIVFPAKGPRPHPNEMAGSDLDGDEYIVIWQKELFFPGSNRDPMVFSDTSVGAPSTGNLDDDIIRFLCEYILNDSVGIMSNAHLAWADQSLCGIFSSTCLRLAEKISVCLDFAKTGISAALTKEERPQKYPDFMHKRGSKSTYRSVRVLGELFRLNEALVGSCSLAFTATDFHIALFEYPGWQKHRSAAEDAMSTYEWMMQKILDQHGIESEAEVVTGVISSVSRYNKSRQDKTSVETLVAKQYSELIDAMQRRFHEDVEVVSSQGPSQQTEKTQLEMVSAWYMVTCTNPKTEEHHLGLPWCIPDALLMLLRQRSNAGLTQTPSSRNLLATKINGSVRPSDSPSGAALNMLQAWARKESLLQDAVGQVRRICSSCLSHAFQQSLSCRQSGTVPSMIGNASPSCGGDSHAPTAGDYVCGFLRYLSTAPTGLLPLCAECSSLQLHKLTLAALHCYSRLVVTRDVCCFDLPCDPDLHDSTQDFPESDPIRINVQNSPFLDMVRQETDVVKELLCRWTGVEEVNIRWQSYRSRKYFYLVVSAVGRQWQLCCFDELMLQPWLQNAIVNRALAS